MACGGTTGHPGLEVPKFYFRPSGEMISRLMASVRSVCGNAFLDDEKFGDKLPRLLSDPVFQALSKSVIEAKHLDEPWFETRTARWRELYSKFYLVMPSMDKAQELPGTIPAIVEFIGGKTCMGAALRQMGVTHIWIPYSDGDPGPFLYDVQAKNWVAFDKVYPSCR